MLTPEERQAAASVTRLTQIIIFALLMGTASFLAVVVLTDANPLPVGQNLAPIAAAFAVGGIVAAFVLNAYLSARQRTELANAPRGANSTAGASIGDASNLLQGFQIRRIIRGALLEGPAFFNLVAYQQERQTYTLAVAAALILGLVMLIPLRPLVESWLENELRQVRELRSLRR